MRGTMLALWVNPLLLSLRPPNLPVRLMFRSTSAF
jgi:hypothetical protein